MEIWYFTNQHSVMIRLNTAPLSTQYSISLVPRCPTSHFLSDTIPQGFVNVIFGGFVSHHKYLLEMNYPLPSWVMWKIRTFAKPWHLQLGCSCLNFPCWVKMCPNQATKNPNIGHTLAATSVSIIEKSANFCIVIPMEKYIPTIIQWWSNIFSNLFHLWLGMIII